MVTKCHFEQRKGWTTIGGPWILSAPFALSTTPGLPRWRPSPGGIDGMLTTTKMFRRDTMDVLQRPGVDQWEDGSKFWEGGAKPSLPCRPGRLFLLSKFPAWSLFWSWSSDPAILVTFLVIFTLILIFIFFLNNQAIRELTGRYFAQVSHRVKKRLATIYDNS